jgi:hypothetical protein
MKRLLVLFLSLFALSSGLFAFPAYPKNDTTYRLPNGHTIELEFYAPQEALPFFDASLLVNGFAKIAETYKINEDFGILFVVHTNNELRLGVVFKDLQAADISDLKPMQGGNGLHLLPLIVPRDAINVVESWFVSFLQNKSADKPTDFLKSIQSTPFYVQYQTKLSNGSLLIEGNFYGSTPSELRPVFNSTMDIEDLSTITNHKISLDPQDFYLSMLQNFYTFVLDPLDDQNNPGQRTENIFVYWLFGLPSPSPVKTGTVQAGSAGTPSANKQVYNVGDTGPAGGIIFYDKGKASDGWRYLEAAPSDQSAGIQWHNRDYCNVKTGTAIGTGKANTDAIIAAQGDGSYAAALCKNLTINGFSDWFLPSKDELALMYTNLKKVGLGGFGEGRLWSSSQDDSNGNGLGIAWYQYFSDGRQDSNFKYYKLAVRACRAF